MWKSIFINRNLIKAATDKAVLIAAPHSSEYDGYAFWHPAKLVRDGRHATVSVSYTAEFVFRFLRYGRNREILDEIPLAADEMEIVMEAATLHIEDKPLFYTPQQLDPENATADESLIDYD